MPRLPGGADRKNLCNWFNPEVLIGRYLTDSSREVARKLCRDAGLSRCKAVTNNALPGKPGKEALMHRSTALIRSLVSFTLCVTLLAPLTAVGQTSGSIDLYDALGQRPAANRTPRVASRQSSALSGKSVTSNSRRQAIREIESTAQSLRNDLSLSKIGHNDIGLALGGGPVKSPTVAEPTPAEPTYTAAASSDATPPAGANQRRPSSDLGLDFISSTASSHATGETAAFGANTSSDTDAVDASQTGDTAGVEFAGSESGTPKLAERSRLAGQGKSSESDVQATVTITDSPNDFANETGTTSTQSAKASQWSSAELDLDTTVETTPFDATNPAASSAKAEQAFSNTTTAPAAPTTATDQGSWNLESSLQSSGFASSATRPTEASTDNLLVTDQLPLITSRVAGPSKILIGREAKYRVTIENRGTASADELTTEVAAPEWAEVVRATASSGAVNRASEVSGTNTLRWSIPNLGAGRSQTLDLVLVPKTSQPLNLGVSWRHAPVASTTLVEVQEPKLAMAISGPDEVFFGRPQTYRLSLSNPGTGAAENVHVQLVPPGGGQAVSSYRVESLAAGESKVVDIEITAREAGELSMQAVATAEGDLRSEAEQKIFCRQAELNVDWRGPNRKYAGTEATYFFRVRNPGTASAEQVQFKVELPSGFEFADASEGHQYDLAGQRVTWKIGTLRPGDDCYLELRGTVNQAGQNEMQLTAENADGDVNDTQTAATEVVALADLKLDVSDPKGPVPVGSEIDYEIVVTNRGRSTAEQVNVVGLFSAGVEPVAAEGGEATITDGRVGFRTIGALSAGQKVRFKIRAKAGSAGTHLFRAEVLCRDLEIKLAAEETTRFFQDESTGGVGGVPIESASRASRFETAR